MEIDYLLLTYLFISRFFFHIALYFTITGVKKSSLDTALFVI